MIAVDWRSQLTRIDRDHGRRRRNDAAYPGKRGIASQVVFVSLGSSTSTVAVARMASSWLRISIAIVTRWLRRRWIAVSTTRPLMKVASPVNAGLRYCAFECAIEAHSPAHAAT